MAAATPGLMTRVSQALRYTIQGVTPSTWMSPQQPLQPMAQETQGRRRDFWVAQNVNYLPRSTEAISFQRLKALAWNCDILGTVIERQKDFVEAVEWKVLPREQEKGKRPSESAHSAKINYATEFLKSPDREHDWAQWMRSVFDEAFVTDATSIYIWPDRGGKPWAFRQIDGSVIKPYIDAYGFRPTAPSPAYAEILKGIPAADYVQAHVPLPGQDFNTFPHLIYFPKNVRVGHDYGCPPVQKIIMSVETAIQRQREQFEFFRSGNINRGIFTGPEEWTSDQIKAWQGYWDGMFEGNIANRARGWWTPAGTKFEKISSDPLKDEFDEWLARIICYAFSTSPLPFVKAMNRGNSESQQEVAEEGGLATYLSWFKRLMDKLLVLMDCAELEFAWSEDREFDPVAADQIADAEVRRGSLTIDEDRDRRGLGPLPNGQGATALIYTAQGAVTLDSVLNPPDPPAPIMLPHNPGGLPPVATKEPREVGKSATSPFVKLAPDDPSAAESDKEQTDREEREALERRHEAEEALLAILLSFLGSIRVRIYRIVQTDLESVATPTEADAARIVADAMAQVDAEIPAAVAKVRAALSDLSDDAADEAVRQASAVLGRDLSSDPAALDAADTATQAVIDRAAEMFGMQDIGGTLTADPDADMNIMATTEKLVAQVVKKGIADGLTEAQISARIDESFAFSEARAEMIARTEANRAWNGTLYEIFEGVGVEAVRWQTMEDLLVDPDCLTNQMAGPVRLGVVFPGGVIAPPQHPRCRCWLTAADFDTINDSSHNEADQE